MSYSIQEACANTITDGSGPAVILLSSPAPKPSSPPPHSISAPTQFFSSLFRDPHQTYFQQSMAQPGQSSKLHVPPRLFTRVC